VNGSSAPEQLEFGTASTASDVYSFAILAYVKEKEKFFNKMRIESIKRCEHTTHTHTLTHNLSLAYIYYIHNPFTDGNFARTKSHLTMF
jgi:hypothetical protein